MSVEAYRRKIAVCQEYDETEPFSGWLETLDAKTKGIVLKRIGRMSDGNFGDCESVGDGVYELRIDHGPGYRIYFGQESRVVYLITGGTKRTQQRDIDAAKAFWSTYD